MHQERPQQTKKIAAGAATTETEQTNRLISHSGINVRDEDTASREFKLELTNKCLKIISKSR